jgi:hypothetical protein
MTFDPSKTISARVRQRIVRDWRSRLRDYSTLALGAGAAIVAAWIALPEDLKAHLPVDIVAQIVGGLNALGLAGKFVVQKPKDEA